MLKIHKQVKCELLFGSCLVMQTLKAASYNMHTMIVATVGLETNTS